MAADIAESQKKLEAGEIHPFTGPIRSNDGREVLKAGEKATDEQLLTMDYLVEGVVGKLPQAG